MSKALIAKLEAAKGKTFGALADSTNYNYGIDKAIAIVRQHEAEQPQNVLNTSSKPLNIEHVRLMLDGIEIRAASAKRVIAAYQEAI